MSRKTSRFKRQLLVNQVGSVNFQRYFFPLDGGGGVLIQSIFNTILPIKPASSEIELCIIGKLDNLISRHDGFSTLS